MTDPARTTRARAPQLVADLHAVATALVAVLEPIEPELWMRVPGPSTWSIGKVAAHVADAAAYHQWIVRLTIGQTVSSRRPLIERTELTTAMSPREAVDLIRLRTQEGHALLTTLTDEQLALPTKPARGRGQVLADTITLVLIGHYDTHRRDIERMLHR